MDNKIYIGQVEESELTTPAKILMTLPISCIVSEPDLRVVDDMMRLKTELKNAKKKKDIPKMLLYHLLCRAILMDIRGPSTFSELESELNSYISAFETSPHGDIITRHPIVEYVCDEEEEQFIVEMFLCVYFGRYDVMVEVRRDYGGRPFFGFLSRTIEGYSLSPYVADLIYEDPPLLEDLCLETPIELAIRMRKINILNIFIAESSLSPRCYIPRKCQKRWSIKNAMWNHVLRGSPEDILNVIQRHNRKFSDRIRCLYIDEAFVSRNWTTALFLYFYKMVPESGRDFKWFISYLNHLKLRDGYQQATFEDFKGWYHEMYVILYGCQPPSE